MQCYITSVASCLSRRNKISDEYERIQGGNEMVISTVSNLFSFLISDILFCLGNTPICILKHFLLPIFNHYFCRIWEFYLLLLNRNIGVSMDFTKY